MPTYYRIDEQGQVIPARGPADASTFTSSLKGGALGAYADFFSALTALGVPAQEVANTFRAGAERATENIPVKTWDDVGTTGEGTLSDVGTFLTQGLGQSIPYIAPMALGALAGGEAAVAGGATGGAAALSRFLASRQLAKELAKRGLREGTAEARDQINTIARQLAMQRGATLGGFAGGSVVGAGDIASNQFEESGTYNPATMLAGAPVYGALGMLGPEMMALKGLTGGRFLPSMAGEVERTGLRGVAERAGKGALYAAPVEAVSETAQEVVNQLGRMSVNPDATLTSGNAPARYLDSLILGGALGGAFGGVGGAFTKPYKPDLESIAERTEAWQQDIQRIADGKKTGFEQLQEAQQALQARRDEEAKQLQKSVEMHGKREQEIASTMKQYDIQQIADTVAAQRADEANWRVRDMQHNREAADLTEWNNLLINERMDKQRRMDALLEQQTRPDTPVAPLVNRILEIAQQEMPRRAVKGSAAAKGLVLDFATSSPERQAELYNEWTSSGLPAHDLPVRVASRAISELPEFAGMLSALTARPITAPAPAPRVKSGFADLNFFAEQLAEGRRRQEAWRRQQEEALLDDQANAEAAMDVELDLREEELQGATPAVTPVEPPPPDMGTATQLEAQIRERGSRTGITPPRVVPPRVTKKNLPAKVETPAAQAAPREEVISEAQEPNAPIEGQEAAQEALLVPEQPEPQPKGKLGAALAAAIKEKAETPAPEYQEDNELQGQYQAVPKSERDKTQVEAEAYNDRSREMETIKTSATKAITALDEDIARVKALIACLKG